MAPIERFGLIEREFGEARFPYNVFQFKDIVQEACSTEGILEIDHFEDEQTLAQCWIFTLGESDRAFATVLIGDIEGMNNVHKLIAPRRIIDKVKLTIERQKSSNS